MDALLTRDAAWALLTEWTKSESLRKHALAVEASVRGYARQFGEDEDAWGFVALLHDFDYERYQTPADHPFRGTAAAWLSGVGHACDPLARRLLGGAA
jgi:predicted hydrolase (HD superfamily)